MKLKITKESITFYRRPIVIGVASILVFYGLNTFVAAPRLASNANSAQLLRDSKSTLSIATKRLADLNATGVAGVNANYLKVASLDKLIPVLPSEDVKAAVLAQFTAVASAAGVNGNLSFTTNTPTSTNQSAASTNTAPTLSATFTAQGSSSQVIDFLSRLVSITPLAVLQSASYTDVSGQKADTYTVSGSLQVVGSKNAAIPLDAAGNPPAPAGK